jgi:hypothetical protein
MKRMPRFRFTIRRMMVVVAVCAVMLGLEVMRRRRVYFLRMAVYHSVEEEQAREEIARSDHHGKSFELLIILRIRADQRYREAAEYRQKLVEARAALKAKQVAGLVTTQAERREPWYWEMQADEAEWLAHEDEGLLAFHERKIRYHTRSRLAFERAASHPWESVVVELPVVQNYQPPSPFQPPPPPQ